MLSRSIFHYHIPKTAGSTLRLIAEDNIDSLELQESIMYRELVSLLIGRPPYPRLQRHVFLSGHFPLYFREILKPPIFTVCSIRDPADLIVSYFHYQKAIGIIPADLSLDDFLHSEAVHTVVNLQTRFMANLAFPEFPQDKAQFYRPASAGYMRQMHVDFSSDSLFEAALRNAETIDCIVDANDLIEGARRLCGQLDWVEPVELPSRNGGLYDRQNLSAVVGERLEEICERDQVLYRQLLQARPTNVSRLALPVHVCDQRNPFMIDFSNTVSGEGWHMRELIPDWGWSRWTSARSSINVNLRLRGHVRYTFFLLLLDAMNPNSLDEIEVYLANKMIQLSFVPDGTNWRGFADILVPGDVLIDKITLTIPNPVRPCDSGLGDDRRLLGVRVKSLMIIA